ncbi:unnamed protein product, partial [Didymodactylos carnosus]
MEYTASTEKISMIPDDDHYNDTENDSGLCTLAYIGMMVVYIKIQDNLTEKDLMIILLILRDILAPNTYHLAYCIVALIMICKQFRTGLLV